MKAGCKCWMRQAVFFKRKNCWMWEVDHFRKRLGWDEELNGDL